METLVKRKRPQIIARPQTHHTILCDVFKIFMNTSWVRPHGLERFLGNRAMQSPRKVECRLIALLRGLLKHLEHHLLDFRSKLGIELAQKWRVLLAMSHLNLHHLASKRKLVGEELVSYDPQAIEITSTLRLTIPVLGCHVVRS